jgi:hypothetical protein
MSRSTFESFAVLIFTAVIATGSAQAQDDSESVRLAKAVLQATHSASLGDQVLAQVTKMVQNGLAETNPGRQKDIDAVIHEALAPEFEKASPALYDKTAQIYASIFTIDELKQLLAFYQTPLGRKLLQSQPEITNGEIKLSQDFTKTVMARVNDRLVYAIQSHGLQAPAGN